MKRWPMKRNILVCCVVYALLLCVALSIANYSTARRARYESFEYYIRDVLDYTASGIDNDDLAECVRTGVESEKYRELQRFLDGIKQHINLHYLYIIIPVNDEPVDNIINVIAGVSVEEYETKADQLVYLNMPAGDAYSPETARKYLNAYESGQLSFFEERTAFGEDYTGLMPLYDSQGSKFAALCMDVDLSEINTQLRAQTIATVAVTAALGALFTLLFLLWTNRNVTQPIEKLENAVAGFAWTSDLHDPAALELKLPALRSARELESLGSAVAEMSRNLRDSVQSMLSAEKELARVSILARKDALTQVGNKTAFGQFCEELQEEISEEPAEFAMLMADANNLKQVNDSNGHDKGDIYLKKCSGVICDVFAHSPVFRVGGDEFVVVLRGQDYANREALIERVRARFDALSADETIPVWERVSAAMGLACFDESQDCSVEDVLNRADRAMYAEKRALGFIR